MEMPCSPLHEANGWIQSAKQQVVSQGRQQRPVGLSCLDGNAVIPSSAPCFKAGTCWQESLTLKHISSPAQLAEILKKQAGTEFCFTSYLQLDPGEVFPATTVPQGAAQISLESVHPVRLGVSPTAAQQS